MCATQISFDISTLNRVTLALAEADDLQAIKAIRDKVEAARKYAQSAALGLRIQNQAAELKLMAERKAGKLLGDMRLRGGDRKSKSQGETLKLADFGVSKCQSARWQREAAVPEAIFKKYVTTANKLGRDITSQGLLRLAKMIRLDKRHTSLRRRKSSVTSNGADVLNGELLSPEPSVGGERNREIRDGLNELQEHRTLLEAILEPLCQSRASRLKRAEKRIVLQLLAEIETIVLDMGAALSCPPE